MKMVLEHSGILMRGTKFSGNHLWGSVFSAIWTGTNFPNDTLTITLSTDSGVPTVAVGDSITIAPGTIMAGGTYVTGSPPSITGDFGSGSQYLDVGDAPNPYLSIGAALNVAVSGNIIRIHPTASNPDYSERVVNDNDKVG